MVRGARLPRRAFFVGFCTDFVTSVRFSVASAGVLVRGGAPRPSAPPPPPVTSLYLIAALISCCGMCLSYLMGRLC